MNIREIINYLKANTLVGIKGGIERDKFTEIWMVNVGDRIFSRSWNRSDKSWFTEIKNTGIAQIKFGESIINVKGFKINLNDDINHKIDRAYLEKYIQPENIEYAKGITQPEYCDYTMEFILED